MHIQVLRKIDDKPLMGKENDATDHTSEKNNISYRLQC